MGHMADEFTYEITNNIPTCAPPPRREVVLAGHEIANTLSCRRVLAGGHCARSTRGPDYHGAASQPDSLFRKRRQLQRHGDWRRTAALPVVQGGYIGNCPCIPGHQLDLYHS